MAMAAAYKSEKSTHWRTTIIISSSLKTHETIKILQAGYEHRIKFSDGVESGAFIFPLSGIAFKLVDPQDPVLQESALVETLSKFVKVHRNCFVLLHAPFNGPKEMDTLSLIQHSFFGSNLRVLPVRSSVDIVKGMMTIAQATSKPFADRICERMALARAQIVEESPVWEMLRDMMLLSNHQ